MNLKKVLGFATVAIACIASAMFAGCTNQMAGSIDSDARMVTLSLSATEFRKNMPTKSKRRI